MKIFDGISSKTTFYVHPTVKMIKEKSEESFAASSISCKDVSNQVHDVDSLAALLRAKSETHFIAVSIDVTDPMEPQRLFARYVEYLCNRWESEQPPRVAVMRCVADIEEHYNFLNQNTNQKSHISNEAGVRYVFGNMIIDMLCRYFKFKITLEESDSVENAASGSKYDYVVWRLMLIEKDKEKNVPIIVLETKHESTLTLKAAAQAISYYSRARQGIDNFTGVAFLLNEWDGSVEFRIILFPYKCNTFGVQAVLLPTITKNFEEFLNGDVIKLICTISGIYSSDEVFSITLPDKLDLVAPGKLVGVYSRDQLTKMERDKYRQDAEHHRQDAERYREKCEYYRKQYEQLHEKMQQEQQQDLPHKKTRIK